MPPDINPLWINPVRKYRYFRFVVRYSDQVGEQQLKIHKSGRSKGLRPGTHTTISPLIKDELRAIAASGSLSQEREQDNRLQGSFEFLWTADTHTE